MAQDAQPKGTSPPKNDPPKNDPPKSDSPSDPWTEAHEGKIEGESFGYASELLAYRAVDNLAGIVAERADVRLPEDARVLLVADLDYATDGIALAELEAQISLMRSAFSERENENRRLLGAVGEPEDRLGAQEGQAVAAPEEKEGLTIAGVVTALTGARSAVALAVDLLAYLRTNLKIVGQSFEVGDRALLSSVAGALAARKVKPFVSGFHGSGRSKVLHDLADLAMQASGLADQKEALASRLPKAPKGEGGDAGKAGQAEEPGGRQDSAALAAAVKETESVLSHFASLQKAWVEVEQGEDKPFLARALAREQVEKLRVDYLLWVDVLSAGGEATVRDRLVRDDSVSFMSGAVISFVLASPDGEVLAADTLSQFAAFEHRFSEEADEWGKVRYLPPYR